MNNISDIVIFSYTTSLARITRRQGGGSPACAGQALSTKLANARELVLHFLQGIDYFQPRGAQRR